MGISSLQQNVEYYWRVRGKNASGFGEWSVIWSFSTDTADYYSPPDTWDFTENTGLDHTIIAPGMLDIEIEGRDIAAGDAIGVFYRDGNEYKCGGYAIWTGDNIAIVAWGDDEQTDEKDGFTDDEDYRFMVWDSRGGEEFYARVVISEGPDHFVDNGITILDALYIPEMLTQDIELVEGWNMISTNVHPEPDSVDWIMQPILDDFLLMRDGDGNMYFPSLGINNLNVWEIENGYKVYATNETVLSVEGLEASPENLPFELDEGWNMIGYPRNESSSVIVMMEDIENDMLLIKDANGNLYFPSFNINTIGEMHPGLGYLTYITSATTLTYPANGFPRQAFKGDKLTPRAKYLLPEIKNTGENMILIAEVPEIQNGSEIGIWTSENILVGSGRVNEGKAAITIWGDNTQTEKIDGATDLESLKAMLFDERSGMSMDLELTGIQSMVSNEVFNELQYNAENIVYATSMIQSVTQTENMALTCKPNPTTGETVIEYNLQNNGYVSIKLFSMSGQLIQIIFDSEMKSGSHTIAFDGSKLANGVYNVQMVVDGMNLNRLLMISK